MIRAEGLSVVRRPPDRGQVVALSGVDFRLAPGELVLVLGRSGAGKTTLFEAVAGLIPPSEGRVVADFGGEVVTWASGEMAPAETRRRVGLLFQYPERQIFGRTAWEDVGWGLGPDCQRLVLEALDRVDIPERLRKAPLFRLSRGEKRRVALAGLLVRTPEVLLLDEPSVGLDAAGRDLLWEEVAAYRVDRRAAVAVATHWPEPLLPLVDRVVCLVSGGVRFSGAPKALLDGARDDRSLVGLLPFPWRLRLALESKPSRPPGPAGWADSALGWLRAPITPSAAPRRPRPSP